MAAYLDASALLRIIFKSEGSWDDIGEGGTFISSSLARVECLRALDRIRILGKKSAADLDANRASMNELFGNLHFIDVDAGIMQRASEPLPGVLGTLDAIHLATARTWGEEQGGGLLFVTHDHALGTVARQMNLVVAGI